MSLTDRIRKLEEQLTPKVDIASILIAGRHKPRLLQNREALEEAVRKTQPGTFENRLARARLRAGPYAEAPEQSK